MSGRAGAARARSSPAETPVTRWVTRRRPAWAVAVASLLPVLPGGFFLLLSPREDIGVLVLLGTVLGACLLGGAAAAVAAGTAATILYEVVVLPPRFTVDGLKPQTSHVAVFLTAVAALIAAYAALERSTRGATHALEQSERRSRALTERVQLMAPVLEGAPIGFGVVDTDLRFLYVNPALARHTRRAIDEHLGVPVDELFGERAALVAEPLRTVLTTGRGQFNVPLTVAVRGQVRHFVVSRYPIHDSDDQPLGVALTLQDTTDAVRLRAAVDQAAAELDAAIASAPFGFALLDRHGTAQRVNAAFGRLFGVPSAGLIGAPAPRVAASLRLDAAALRRVVGTGAPIVEREVRVGGRDLLVSCFPARLPDERTIGCAVQAVDSTEQRRLAELARETERLRATAELVAELETAQRMARLGSWEADRDSGRVRWSRALAEIIGVDPADAPTTLPESMRYLQLDDVDVVSDQLGRLIEDGTPFQREARIHRVDGTLIDVMTSGEAIRDDTGRVVRLRGAVQDVTAQRSAERTVQRTRDQLAAEHRTLQLFQRAMLPRQTPALAGADLATAYLPVTDRLDIGGDWYDAFSLPDGRTAVAIGDVSGHDLRAATIMGQVRNAVRAYAIEDPGPGAVLRRVNTLLTSLPDLDLVSMLFGVYDPGRHELRWSRAGHPPPLLRRDGTVQALEDPAGMLLGVVGDDAPYAEGRLLLRPGDAVLWYTDGLVDQRSLDVAAAMERLCGLLAAAGAGADANTLVRTVPAEMIAQIGHDDDICVLAISRPVPGPAGDPDRVPRAAAPVELPVTVSTTCAEETSGDARAAVPRQAARAGRLAP